MKTVTNLLVSTAIVLSICSNVWAVDRRVPTPYRSIRSAIDAAVPGDRILIAGNRLYTESLIINKASLTIQTDPSTTGMAVIEAPADKYYTVQVRTAAKYCKLKNLEIVAPIIDGSTAIKIGPVEPDVVGPQMPSITNCVVRGNSINNPSIGISENGCNGGLTIRNSTIYGSKIGYASDFSCGSYVTDSSKINGQWKSIQYSFQGIETTPFGKLTVSTGSKINDGIDLVCQAAHIQGGIADIKNSFVGYLKVDMDGTHDIWADGKVSVWITSSTFDLCRSQFAYLKNGATLSDFGGNTFGSCR